MAAKTSRVSNTSSRLVWMWLLTQPIEWPPSVTTADRILARSLSWKSQMGTGSSQPIS
jgi:hypothetical protein